MRGFCFVDGWIIKSLSITHTHTTDRIWKLIFCTLGVRTAVLVHCAFSVAPKLQVMKENILYSCKYLLGLKFNLAFVPQTVCSTVLNLMVALDDLYHPSIFLSLLVILSWSLFLCRYFLSYKLHMCHLTIILFIAGVY